MRIGLDRRWRRRSTRSSSRPKQAEADGFSSLWYASAGHRRPARRDRHRRPRRRDDRARHGGAADLSRAIRCSRRTAWLRSSTPWAAPGFTLGIGPSHEPLIRGVFGLSYDHPGPQHRGVRADPHRVPCAASASTSTAPTGPPTPPAGSAPVVQPGAGARLGARAAAAARRGRGRRRNRAVDGASRGRSSPTSPPVHAAASAAGRPVAAHRRRPSGRRARRRGRGPLRGGRAPRRSTPGMANYQRILEIGGAASPADAAIVGNEASVRAQLQALLDAGATDIWAAVFPVGDDRDGRRRVATPDDGTAQGADRLGVMAASRRTGTSPTRAAILDGAQQLMVD